MLQTNYFYLCGVTRHSPTDGPFSLQWHRCIFRCTDGPASAKGGRVTLLARPGQLSDNFDSFRDWAEAELQRQFGNPAEIEDLPEDQQLDGLPQAWQVKSLYMSRVNRPARKRRHATTNEAQGAAAATLTTDAYADPTAGHVSRPYSGFSQGENMKFLAAYPDGSFLASDGLLHAADGSLLRPAPRSAAQATADFASADSDGIDGVDPVTRAKNAYERARRDLSDAESAAQSKIEQMDADNMPASRREDLLAQSSLGRRCLIDADDPKYKKAVRRAKADRAAAKSLTVTSGPEKSRTYNAGKGS